MSSLLSVLSDPDSQHNVHQAHPNAVTTSPPMSAITSMLDGNASDSSSVNDSADDLWIFGYGSLVWKVDFPVAESQTGYIRGFQRRFYQHSIDHRGTPEKPGRVVTLIPSASADGNPTARDEDDRVYGVAYRISNEQRAAVIEHLDHREKNGYARHTVDFYPYPDAQSSSSSPSRPICLYVATADNESFAGPLPMPKLAQQVLTSRGPSGPNVEYVYRLADAMRAMFPATRDEHLFELERTIRELERGAGATDVK